MRYAEQQAMQYYHWTPAQYGEQDYFDMQATLSAKNPKEYHQNIFSLFGAKTR